jgi:hypothetical protein
MRDTLIHVRVKHRLHRHSKERPVSLPLTFVDWTGKETVKQVSISDFPDLWAMPIYEYPGILMNVKPEDTRFGRVHAKSDKGAYQKLLALPGVKSVTATSGGVNAWIFARWIAKISYCFAVACLGLSQVKSSLLVDMILKGCSHPNYLVGGLNKLDLQTKAFTLEPPTNHVFCVQMTEIPAYGKTYRAVSIRLLPMLEGATYIAVVGEKP